MGKGRDELMARLWVKSSGRRASTRRLLRIRIFFHLCLHSGIHLDQRRPEAFEAFARQLVRRVNAVNGLVPHIDTPRSAGNAASRSARPMLLGRPLRPAPQRQVLPATSRRIATGPCFAFTGASVCPGSGASSSPPRQSCAGSKGLNQLPGRNELLNEGGGCPPGLKLGAQQVAGG